MSVIDLDKVTLVGHISDEEKVLADLQGFGCLHLIPLTPEGEVAAELGPSKDARQALRFLASSPQHCRQVTHSREFDAAEIERRALDLQRRLYDMRNERDLLATRIEDIEKWGDFEFPPLETLNGQRLWFYLVPQKLMKDLPETGLVWEVVKKAPHFCYVVVVSKDEPQQMPVERIHIGHRSYRQLTERLEEVELELEDLEAERYSLTRWCTLLARSIDGLEDRSARAHAAAQTAVAGPVYALQAWAPRDRIGQLRDYAVKEGLALEVVRPDPSENPPTLFKHASAVGAGEDLVKAYMTPSYWLWDPCSAVFLSFSVFFAMILADTGYAFVLACTIFAYRKKMTASKVGRRWLIMLSTLAGATAVYGILVGSYFGMSPPEGSFLHRLKVLDLNDFSTMMNLSIVVGAVHIAYACIRDALRFTKWQQRMPSIGWACGIIGALAAWRGNQMANQIIQNSGVGLLCGGLIFVIMFAGYGEKPIKRIVKGFSALTGISGAFGDVLSYLRLFALGLSSASLAIAFNNMAGQVRQAAPGIGILLALLILLLGHGLNFLLSVSSGFIHGLRLNFIEFFKWGVKDEGISYRPFERKESV